MLFWAPQEKSFFTCSDARPEVQRGFDPVARYKQAGPWSGLGGPGAATGRRLLLDGPMLSATGRISGSEKTSVTVLPRDATEFVARLEPRGNWSELALERAAAQRSLLAPAQPARDWVVLRPRQFQRAEFNAARQALTWTLVDDEGASLTAELVFDDYTAPAIERLEQTDMSALPVGTLLVARLRGGSRSLVAEPLSFVYPHARGDEAPVDALYFDAAPKAGFAAKMLARLKSRGAAAELAPLAPSAIPPLLTDLRQWLRRQAERGMAWELMEPAKRELAARRHRLNAAGFTAFQGAEGADVADELLRTHYLCQQYEHLLDDSPADAA